MKCPNCGSEQDNSALFCGSCGAKLPAFYNQNMQPKPTPQVPPVPPKPPVTPGAGQPGTAGKPVPPVNPVPPQPGVNDKRQDHITVRHHEENAFKNDGTNAVKKKNSGCLTAVLVAVAVVLVAIVAAVASFMLFLNNRAEVPVTPTQPTQRETQQVDPPVVYPTQEVVVPEMPVVVEPTTQAPVTPNQPTTQAPVTPTTPTGGEYLFPFDTRAITRADLEGKTKAETRLLRNELYARHGYVFNSQDLKDYFGSKSWYRPDSSLSQDAVKRMIDAHQYEGSSLQTILAYESEKGWR